MNASSRLLITLGFIASGAVLLTPQTAFAQDRSSAADADRTIQRMSAPDLKSFYLQCSQGALQNALSGSDIRLCSVVYEALLNRTFKGDFLALLAWSRSQATAATASGSSRGAM